MASVSDAGGCDGMVGSSSGGPEEDEGGVGSTAAVGSGEVEEEATPSSSRDVEQKEEKVYCKTGKRMMKGKDETGDANGQSEEGRAELIYLDSSGASQDEETEEDGVGRSTDPGKRNSRRGDMMSDGTVEVSDDDNSNEASIREVQVSTAVKEDVNGVVDVPSCDDDTQEPSTSNAEISSAETKPLMSVTFRDEDVARKYSMEVEKYLVGLLAKGSTYEGSRRRTTPVRLQLDLWEGFVMDTSTHLPQSPIDQGSEAEPGKMDVEVDVASTVAAALPKDASHNSVWGVPHYQKSFVGVMRGKGEGEASKEEAVGRQSSCFNCGGTGHRLPECQEPRDPARIARNRRSFMDSGGGGGGGGQMRYHQGGGNMGAGIVPGQLSNALRMALNLRSNQLPFYVYQMRLWGYPPGWLQEAELTPSGLELFDGTTTRTKRRDTSNDVTFDPDKLVDFPGYNMPIPSGMVDESSSYGMPPLSAKQLKFTMTKRLKRSRSNHNRQEESEVPAKRRCESPVVVDIADDGRGSPSLNELEEVHKKLLGQLNEHAAGVKTEGVASKVVPEVVKEEVKEVVKEVKDSAAEAVKKDVYEPRTPVLPSVSPYEKLPDASHFSDGMGPMEFFENMPNSTGKFQTMNSLLQKVRRRVMYASIPGSKSPSPSTSKVQPRADDEEDGIIVEDDDDSCVIELDMPSVRH